MTLSITTVEDCLAQENVQTLLTLIRALPNVHDVRVFPPLTQPAFMEQLGPNCVCFAIVVTRPTAQDPDFKAEIWCPMGEELWNRTSEHQRAITWVTSRLSPPPVNLASVKADAVSKIIRYAEQIGETLTGPIPLHEKLSWPAKEEAAVSYLAGSASTAQTVMLQAEADLTQETLSVLATRVVNRAALFRLAASKIAGLRRKVCNEINALTDVATVESDVAAILAQAKADADFMLAQIQQGG